MLKPLKDYKKGKREVFVDWNKNIVTWNEERYHIRFINVGGENIPYVDIEEVKSRSEIKHLINTVNKRENKKQLKFVEYELNSDTYYVTGIGKDAIKALKNNETRPKFYNYFSLEGQQLLKKIASTINTVLV